MDTQAQSFPVSLDDIRHVIRLEDTETGKLENVLVKHAYSAGPYNERPPHSKLPGFTRYVTGLDIEIPWPMEDDPVITDGDMDTSRMEVEASTFVATMKEPPMPSTVIDELRNKYSKFRTRHDPEYLKAKMIEDYEQEYRGTASMRTPKTDARNFRAAQTQAKRQEQMDANGNMQLSAHTKSVIAHHLEKVHGLDKESRRVQVAVNTKVKENAKLAAQTAKAAKKAQAAKAKTDAAKAKKDAEKKAAKEAKRAAKAAEAPEPPA